MDWVMQPWWERSAFSQFTNPNANLFPTHPRRHSQERGDCHTEGLEPGMLTQGAGCQLPWRQATLSASLWPGLGDEACHPLPQMLYWKEWHLCPKVLVAQSCPTLCGPMDCSPPVSSPWDSPGKNTGVGCHALLQGIFQTQESNPGLLHCRQILYRLNHQGSPKEAILKMGPNRCTHPHQELLFREVS